MATRLPILAVPIFAALLGGGGWHYLSDRPAEPETIAPLEQQAPDFSADAVIDSQSPGAEPELLPVAKPTPSPEPDSAVGHVRLPNGQFIPNLNGVKSSDRLKWGGGTFPAITGKIENTDGLEWYVLENGDYLTTVNESGTNAAGEAVRRDLIIHLREGEPLPHLHEGLLFEKSP